MMYPFTVSVLRSFSFVGSNEFPHFSSLLVYSSRNDMLIQELTGLKGVEIVESNEVGFVGVGFVEVKGKVKVIIITFLTET